MFSLSAITIRQLEKETAKITCFGHLESVTVFFFVLSLSVGSDEGGWHYIFIMKQRGDAEWQ